MKKQTKKEIKKEQRKTENARVTMVSICIVLAVLLALLAYLYIGTRLQITVTNEYVTAADKEPELFEELLTRAKSGALDSGQYKPLPGDDPSLYSIAHIRLQVRSIGLLPCEWLTAAIAPNGSDYALVRSSLPDVGPFGSCEGELLVLTKSDAAEPHNSIWVDYYAYGLKTYAEAASK